MIANESFLYKLYLQSSIEDKSSALFLTIELWR